MTFNQTIKNYYNLAKPGIVYGNLVTVVAGFLFASHWHGGFGLFIATIIASTLSMGSGCVVNNVIDRNIDKKMERTKKRATVTGVIPVRSALIYAGILGVVGCLIFAMYVNVLTLIVALIGFILYVFVYAIAKRRTVYGTMVGALVGAIPPLMGYTAYANFIGQAAVVLVFILICWQLTHFYGIALYRKKEYAAAKIPVWPVVKGDWSAELQAIGFIGLFTVFTISLFFLGYTGYIYLIVTLLVGLGWLAYAVINLNKLDPPAWGRRIFLSSLSVLLIISVALALGPVLP